MLFQSGRGRATRRAFPIHGYVGPNGGGKSACMVGDTLASLDAGRTVLSTVRLLDFRNSRPCDDESCEVDNHDRHLAAHPAYRPFTEWVQLLEAEHCDVLMDEVTGVASSRDSASMPSQVSNFLVQLRRRDIVLRWTSPSMSRADVIIRQCSQAITLCRGYFPKSVPMVEGEPDRLWRHRRLFRWVTYDAALLDDFYAGKRDLPKPWKQELHWGPGSPIFDAYDTFDAVDMIGTVSESGRCLNCGGNRRAPACSCPKPVGSPSSRPSRTSRPDPGEAARVPLAGAPSSAGQALAAMAREEAPRLGSEPECTEDHPPSLVEVGAQ